MTMHAPTIEQVRGAWDALAPRFDRFTTGEWTMPFGERLTGLIDLGPGVRFLDVACGSGALAIPAARTGAYVTAVDIAPAMIDHLRSRASQEGLSTIDAGVMNGEALDLPDDTFDVSASLNGVSVFPALQAGLSEMTRVTKPGGQVMVACFGAPYKAEFLTLLIGALKASVPGFTPPPMDPPPLPFQLADPGRFHDQLAAAGLTEVRIDTVTWEMTRTSADRFWDVATSGHPIAVQLTSDLTDKQRTEAKRVLDGMFRERSGGEPDAAIHTEMNIGIGIA